MGNLINIVSFHGSALDPPNFNPYYVILFFFIVQIPSEPSINAKLSDICIGGSAAPVYLPSHYFQNNDREFNLIDGGIVNNNPVSRYL